jgi:hypothetical protein
MLIQDHLGYVHDVPDSRMGGVIVDGLGNPVGLFPALAAALPAIGGLVSKALPMVSSLVPQVGKLFGGGGIPGLPNIGNLVGSIFGGGRGAPAAAPAPAPGMPFMPPIPRINIVPRFPFPNFGQMFRNMFPIRNCAAPIGWTTPALPYTGALPRRLYMRCSVWPGPKGLVPVSAATAAAAQAQAAAAQAAAAAAGGGGRFRRRGRRRR